MLGLVVNTKPADLDNTITTITEEDTALQMAYVAQQRLDGYAEAIAHALKRKSAFDKKVLTQKPGEVTFANGQLVQIYRSDLDYTFKTERKLLPKWSTPHRVASKLMNSYILETLKGEQLPGTFSARRLRRFIPKEGTKLAEEQRKIEELNIQKEQQNSQEADERTDNTPSPDTQISGQPSQDRSA